MFMSLVAMDARENTDKNGKCILQRKALVKKKYHMFLYDHRLSSMAHDTLVPCQFTE